MSRPAAMQIRDPAPWSQSIVSRTCHRIFHNMIHVFHIERCHDTYILKATRPKLIRSTPGGKFGVNMSGFAIEAAGQDAPVSPPQPTIERLTIRRRLAFGIHSKFGSTSARPALLDVALGASLGQAWRRLRRWIARSRQRHAL